MFYTRHYTCIGADTSLPCFLSPRCLQMPVGDLLSCHWSSSEHSPRVNYHKLLNMPLCDYLPRQSPILKGELPILFHVYYFIFSFIKIHCACHDNLIKPFSLHSTGNFSTLLSTLANFSVTCTHD